MKGSHNPPTVTGELPGGPGFLSARPIKAKASALNFPFCASVP